MTNSSPTIVISGASGFLGAELVKYFSKREWHVIALVRKPSDYKNTRHVHYKKYDMNEPIDSSYFENADYLVHTAYIKHSSKQPGALSLNIRAAKDLLQASREHKLKKNVFISSMSAHQQATSTYGRQKLAIEKIFHGKDSVVLRSGLIVGQGGIVKNMVQFMKTKRVVPIVGNGRQPLQIIGVYDLVKIIEVVLSKKHLHGIFTVATTQVYAYKEFYQAIAKHLTIRVVYIPVPYPLLLLTLKSLSKLPISLDIDEENLRGLKQLQATSTAEDLTTIGVTVDSLEVALAKTYPQRHPRQWCDIIL